MWLVPLSRVLIANGYGQLPAFAYATSAIAAFISPLIFGAMADRHVSPVRVLRWLALAAAASTAVVSWSISHHYPAVIVLALIQVYALCSAPTGSIASTIIFSSLHDSQRQFGPLRALGTFGWMCGCWLLSLLALDHSSSAGYAAMLAWIGLAAATISLPQTAPPPGGRIGLRERMGWDSLRLLKNRDHRVVFLTGALFSIPMAAFYPITPLQLQALGFERTSAWMTLGQVTEIIAMICLAGLLARYRLKWIFAAGLAAGIVRFAMCAANQKYWVLAGVTLHGLSLTLFFITAQIYLNERIEKEWRARAQALMSLMNSGIGNLVGYLSTGYWFAFCAKGAGGRWPLFWIGITLAVSAVLLFFLMAYRGIGLGLRAKTEKQIV